MIQPLPSPAMAAPDFDQDASNGIRAQAPFRPCASPLSECRVELLPLLFELNRLVSSNQELPEILRILLDILARHMGMRRGVVSLFDPKTGSIFIHESFGLTEEEAARGCYQLGEGITGKVVETGQAVAIPKIGAEPSFLNRTGSRSKEDNEHAFLCVPIQRGRKVMGTISAERIYDNRQLLEMDQGILSILAATTAQAIELYLLENVRNAALAHENQRLRQALKTPFKPERIIGNSKPMQEVYRLIEKVARSRTTVLILGESGVGKELVASAIHDHSACKDGPFIKFNCAALPESVIESELFGHERGAFTGATHLRRGRFEEADGGTIFLDEVGELSLPMQAKLLRVLQEKSFERVGGNLTLQVEIRILAATNRNLQEMVDQGSFREDLYYRLNVFPVIIPPLRERGSDVISLADHFVLHFSRNMGFDVHRISTPALNTLMAYRWPGNVRELENVIERAMLLAEEGVIHGYHLPPPLHAFGGLEGNATISLDTKLNAIEYEMIVEALKLCRGNISEAATQLGLTRRILRLKMSRHGLDYKTFRKLPHS